MFTSLECTTSTSIELFQDCMCDSSFSYTFYTFCCFCKVIHGKYFVCNIFLYAEAPIKRSEKKQKKYKTLAKDWCDRVHSTYVLACTHFDERIVRNFIRLWHGIQQTTYGQTLFNGGNCSEQLQCVIFQLHKFSINKKAKLTNSEFFKLKLKVYIRQVVS